MRGILLRHLIDARFQAGDLLGQQRRPLVQLDIVGQQARTLFAQPPDLRRDGVAPRRGLAELLLQPAHGAALAAMPLFQPRQFRARGRMLFADGRRLPFQLLQFLPLGLQSLFALRAQPLLLLHRGAIALALLGRFLGVAPQPLQFQPRHATAASWTRDRSSPSLRIS